MEEFIKHLKNKNKEFMENANVISDKGRTGHPYQTLHNVLMEALEQAQNGKGKERHAEEGEHFEDQQICEITHRCGMGFPLGQAVKKIQETKKLDTSARRVHELLGAINYLAAAIIVDRETDGNEDSNV